MMLQGGKGQGLGTHGHSSPRIGSVTPAVVSGWSSIGTSDTFGRWLCSIGTLSAQKETKFLKDLFYSKNMY